MQTQSFSLGFTLLVALATGAAVFASMEHVQLSFDFLNRVLVQ